MSTDWDLVQAMMASAIDACERFETLGLAESDREAMASFQDQQVSVFEILTSAWTYPETVRYQIVRQRHTEGKDQPYVPETARILVNVAQVCAELIGSGTPASAEEICQKMLRWYRDHALPPAEAAVRARLPQIKIESGP